MKSALVFAAALVLAALVLTASAQQAAPSFNFLEALEGNWKIDITNWNLDDADSELVVSYGNATFTKETENTMTALYAKLTAADETAEVEQQKYLRVEFETSLSGGVRVASDEATDDELGLVDLLQFAMQPLPNGMWVSHGKYGSKTGTEQYELIVQNPNAFVVSVTDVAKPGSGFTITASKIIPDKSFLAKYGPMMFMFAIFIGMRLFTGKMTEQRPTEAAQQTARDAREGAASAAAPAAAAGAKKESKKSQ